MKIPTDTPHNATDTSTLAAMSAKKTAGPNGLKVFKYIKARGSAGATRDEIAVGTKIILQSVCSRVRVLEAYGWIRDSGLRRKSRTGRQARVMVANPKSKRRLFPLYVKRPLYLAVCHVGTKLEVLGPYGNRSERNVVAFQKLHAGTWAWDAAFAININEHGTVKTCVFKPAE